MNKNQVIVLGNDHVNTLGVIRAFGENNINVILFIVSDTKFIAVNKSKYVEKYYICNNEETAIKEIIKLYSNELLKPVIIPCSDKAAYEIDMNYNKLNGKFIISNINNTQGEIVKYMDKYEQYKIAKENNINIAKSLIIDLPFDNKISLKFPVILKPIISVNGQKVDITICENKESFNNVLKKFYQNNYTKVLVQEYLDYDCEYDIVGFSFKENISMPICCKKIRIWPKKKGSTTFGEIRPINNINSMLEQIKTFINKINYSGIFDIEVFKVGDNFYFNEINFRNSRIAYAYGESNICYYWYLSNINNKFINAPKIEENYYFICEQTDMHNVLEKRISLKQYLNDKKKAKIKLLSNKNDIKPAIFMIIIKILRKLNLIK